MLPKLWGEPCWICFHAITLGYPEHPTQNDKIRYRQYFEDFQYVLPCDKCAYNMNSHLQIYPLTDEVLASRTHLVMWGIDIHNAVNRYTGKPILSYQDALKGIQSQLNRQKPDYSWFFVIILILIILVLYLFYLLKFKKIDKRINSR